MRLAIIMLCVVLITACAPNLQPGPRLVDDVTLPPRTATNTRVPSDTPENLPTLEATTIAEAPTSILSEINSPLQVVTIQADFILVTPTLPPSKTPTETPTITTTPTISPTPTLTATDTATAPVFPTSIFTPTTAPVFNPLPQVCDTLWHWVPTPASGCPATRPMARNGVYQSFITESSGLGYMFWVDFIPFGETPENDIGGDDRIYILYSDGTWDMEIDWFVDPPPAGPPSTEPVLDNDRGPWCFPPGSEPICYQPARGFGLVWRNSYMNDRRIYNKIGWANMKSEVPYQSLKYYEEPFGAIYLNDPWENVYVLFPYGGWARYGSQSSIPSYSPVNPPFDDGWIPIPGVP
jgi:hypothetical protein